MYTSWRLIGLDKQMQSLNGIVGQVLLLWIHDPLWASRRRVTVYPESGWALHDQRERRSCKLVPGGRHAIG